MVMNDYNKALKVECEWSQLKEVNAYNEKTYFDSQTTPCMKVPTIQNIRGGSQQSFEQTTTYFLPLTISLGAEDLIDGHEIKSIKPIHDIILGGPIGWEVEV